MLLQKLKTNPQQKLYEELSEKYQKVQAENRELKTVLTALSNLAALYAVWIMKCVSAHQLTA